MPGSEADGTFYYSALQPRIEDTPQYGWPARCQPAIVDQQKAAATGHAGPLVRMYVHPDERCEERKAGLTELRIQSHRTT